MTTTTSSAQLEAARRHLEAARALADQLTDTDLTPTPEQLTAFDIRVGCALKLAQVEAAIAQAAALERLAAAYTTPAGAPFGYA